MPTHNRPDLLLQALLSIVNQSYDLIEIIIIANGCDDKTNKIVKQFKQQHHQNIIYFEFEQALGGAKARNIGIEAATGEYIAFLDDDDTWHPDKLKIQLELLQQQKVAIVGSSYFCLNANNQHRAIGKLKSPYLGLENLYYENTLSGFSFCLTKKIYLGESRINENLTALQDWDLWLKILKNTGLPAYVAPERLVYYRISGQRISNNAQKVIKGQQIFLQYWRHDLDKPSIDYHKMRIICLQIKMLNSGKIYRYLSHLPYIISAVFFSSNRYNLKKYLHYLLLPWVDMNAFRAKINSK